MNEDTTGHVSSTKDAQSIGDYIFEVQLSKERYEEMLAWLQGLAEHPLPYQLSGGHANGIEAENCASFGVWALRRATGLRLQGMGNSGGSPWFTPGMFRRILEIARELKHRNEPEYAEVCWYPVDPASVPKQSSVGEPPPLPPPSPIGKCSRGML